MAFALSHGMHFADMQALRSDIESNINHHRGWYIFQGIAFLGFGILAIILPVLTALSAALFVGALLFITGIVQLVASFQSRMHWWSALSAILSIVVGGWMLWMPMSGVLALVIATAIFFAAEGIFEIMMALEFRPAYNWGWMMASGIAALVLFVLLWVGFPDLSVFYLGVLIAINFIFYGISLLMLMASAPREA